MSSDPVSEEANLNIFYVLHGCYGLNSCVHPQKMYIEILTLKVMVLEDEASGKV